MAGQVYTTYILAHLYIQHHILTTDHIYLHNAHLSCVDAVWTHRDTGRGRREESFTARGEGGS